MNYLAVFKGRSGCLKCQRELEADSVPVKVVNTPRETGYGCGISLEIPSEFYGRASAVTSHCDGFRGWWVITRVPSGTLCTRL